MSIICATITYDDKKICFSNLSYFRLERRLEDFKIRCNGIYIYIESMSGVVLGGVVEVVGSNLA